ncbi:DNA-3-methyladenine glycosylase I [Oricola cellulosilytica]|uniref:3-methyladenine DNA glycosylase n=1 Tax=Oricola cellulosilytica TaxID=1429082 RepID=A0A4R0PB76_9HYPH|nr:DNA-3-methyladenine glycosylase I [Oricola cellulosilytica]TCD14501.1 3-methyladenine DNA glycosylase [Oricola cellulosilytica]
MRSFDEIFEIAAERQGGHQSLEAKLDPPLLPRQLAAIPDDRWLSCMTKCIFNAGFNWKVVDNMWPGFEEAFQGFDIGRCAMLNEDDIARLAADVRIVRHGGKIRSVQHNAVFLQELAGEHGSAAQFFADWPATDQAGLLETLKRRGTRLGGATGQYFLRFMGKDSYVLSRDVVARLIAEGVVDRTPASKKAMSAVQSAFNRWMEESGRSAKEISRTLAMSIG